MRILYFPLSLALASRYRTTILAPSIGLDTLTKLINYPYPFIDLKTCSLACC